ncbi:hypothetical protein L6452_12754 [Arctium lappa]|uniref:Uncharacterized protein n=1 Tax=Arctium lappa TaxID=4217 RepID=A0ACB9CGA7_ARCLA|nr:hypothetical protein L6452_12754 [Arctium lappa]
MAQGNLHLPDDLLSSQHSWTPKVEASGGKDKDKMMGMLDDSKDHAALDSSIPLSPQWLYAKPGESKMEMRAPSSLSLGNSADSNVKEWRPDGTDDKKDWRKVASETESGRRWREEERETGLLGRRERRKTDRRVDVVRETTDTRAPPPSDRWHDAGNRSSGHEVRRDSKWSSRWGPDEKEKEPQTEKRTDTEKEDGHGDTQTHSSSTRLISERDSDSRDKWRPRHRMEVNSTGPGSFRAAPGFGLERGRTEGSNMGFTIGRGRSSGTAARPSSAGSIEKDESVPGKPCFPAGMCFYPRGKLLDIYRMQNVDPSFSNMPEKIMQVPPITQVMPAEPLAFVAPGKEEEAILGDIWKGKVTSSELSYNSFGKVRSPENIEDFGDFGSTAEKDGILSLVEELVDPNKRTHQTDAESTPQLNGPLTNLTDGQDASWNGEQRVSEMVAGMESTYEVKTPSSKSEIVGLNHDDASNFKDVKHQLFDEVKPSSEQFLTGNMQPLKSSTNKHLASGIPPEELSLYYCDPQGEIQGPFLGVDIVSWFEQGFFGSELPVRIADAPEGTPFEELGEVMPQLKTTKNDPSPNMDHPGAFKGSLDAGTSVSAPVSEMGISADDPHWQLAGNNGLSTKHAQLRMSEHEVNLQLPYSEDQGFHDEEIVFPGNSHDIIGKALRGVPYVNNHTVPADLTEPGTPSQNDNKLHPFGLLWSELDGSSLRKDQPSKTPFTGGIQQQLMNAGCGGADSTHAADTWSAVYRRDALSETNLYQDAGQLSHMDQEANHFDLAEKLRSQHIQQQLLQQHNLLSASHLNEPVLNQLPGRNLINQQQLAGHDLEHFLALQLQHQQRQIQLQQPLQLQPQQFQRQQMLLKEQQSRQQMLLEQLVHNQMQDGRGRLHNDAVRSNNALDHILLKHQIFSELQQQRHIDPSMEHHLIQAKYGQLPPHQAHPNDLLELMGRAKHGQMPSLEHQREQFHGRQLPMGLRQRVEMEEEMQLGSSWPVDETSQFLRNTVGLNRVNSVGLNPLDFYQQQQRLSHEDLSLIERNLSVQERLQRGLYDSNLLPSERSFGGGPGMNINSLSRAQNIDIQDSNARLHHTNQVGRFSSSVLPHQSQHPLAPTNFCPSHLDVMERPWSENNESRFQQLHINNEKQQKRDMEARRTLEDPSLWMSAGTSDDTSKRLLMDLLHQKPGNQPTEPLDIDSGTPFERRLPSPSFNLSDQQVGLNHPFAVGSYGSNAGASMDETIAGLKGNDRLHLGSTHEESTLFGVNGSSQAVHTNSMVPMEREFLYVEGKRRSHKDEVRGPAAETQESMSQQGGVTAVDHNSLGFGGGNAGLYIDKVDSFSGEAKDWVTTTSRWPENIMLKRPPVARAVSSHEELSEMASGSDVRGRNAPTMISHEGGRREIGGGENSKEVRFRRTPSFSSDGDVSASFSEMLKSNGKSHTTAEGAEGKSGKKKGKKGRQIDPALLGFKVTSNRMMMGEIQRIED